MKKILLFALCSIMCLSLFACGEKPEDHTPVQPPVYSEPVTPVQPPEPAVPQPPKPEKSAAFTEAVCSFNGEKTAVFEDGRCALYVTFVDKRSIGILCRNLTSGRLRFSLDDFAVNGWMTDVSLDVTVNPGSQQVTSVALDSPYPSLQSERTDKVAFFARVSCPDADGIVAAERFCSVFCGGATENSIVFPQRDTAVMEHILVDNHALAFIALEAEKKDGILPELKCYVENRTGDIVNLWISGMCVNGWSAEPYHAVRLLPFSREYIYLDVNCPSTERLGIRSLEEVGFNLRMHSAYGNDPTEYISTTCYTYPTGLSAINVDVPVRKSAAGEQILLDSDVCTVILEPVARIGDDTRFSVYAYNKTTRPLGVMLDEFSINGRECPGLMIHQTLQPGMQCYAMVRGTADMLSDGAVNDPDDIETINALLSVYELDSATNILTRRVEGIL